VFVVFMAIAIPISFAIKYWQWTLTIGIPIVVFLLITRSRNIAKRRSGTEAIKPDAGA
jgi:hypothetical protein